jgi:sugar phosphate permease
MDNGLKARPRIFYGWIVLAVAFITIVLGYALRNTFSVFYPAIVEEFGWGRGSTAVMFSISLLVYGLTAPAAGSIVDRYDPRFVLPMGAFIAGGGLALCSLATTQWHFYILYGVVVATGLSIVGWTPLIAIVSNWFAKRRGMAFGILAGGFGSSLVFASVAQLIISSFEVYFFRLCALFRPWDRHCGTCVFHRSR